VAIHSRDARSARTACHRLGLAVRRRVVALDALVVAAAEQAAGGPEQRAADRDAALVHAGARASASATSSIGWWSAA
jgi:hypothetical protein